MVSILLNIKLRSLKVLSNNKNRTFFIEKYKEGCSSWRMTRNLNEIPNLFFDSNISYEVELFICACGEKEFFIKNKSQKIRFRCKECGNHSFLDANEFDYRYIHTSLFENCTSFIKIEHSLKGISSVCYVLVPSGFCILEDKVTYKEIEIYSISRYFDGSIDDFSVTYYDKKLNIKLHDTLQNHLSNYKSFVYEDKRNILLKKKELLNVLLNIRSEKSVRRAVLENCDIQITFDKKLDLSLINIFIQKVKDPNILATLISLNLESFLLSNKFDINGFSNLIIFLFEVGYSSKNILTIFKKECNLSILEELIETHNYFEYEREESIYVEQRFRKTSLDLISISKEYEKQVKYINSPDLVFKYEENDLSKCLELSGYKIRLPENSNELNNWGDSLSNCLGSYHFRIYSNEKRIFGFFRENKIAFAVDLEDNIVLEASAKSNIRLSTDEQNALDSWISEIKKTFE